MPDIKRLTRRWSTDPALGALDKSDAKRVIDALTMAMLSDHDLAATEEDTFEEVINQLSMFGDWSQAAELHTYARQSCRNAFAAASAGKEVLLEEAYQLGGRIPKAVHTQVFGMMVAITVADRAMEEGEGQILSRFAKAFSFSEEDAEAIYNDTLDALGLVTGDDA